MQTTTTTVQPRLISRRSKTKKQKWRRQQTVQVQP
jgi:hypothetical protein